MIDLLRSDRIRRRYMIIMEIVYLPCLSPTGYFRGIPIATSKSECNLGQFSPDEVDAWKIFANL